MSLPFAQQHLAEVRKKLAEGRCPVAGCGKPLPCEHREAPKPKRRRRHRATFAAFDRLMLSRGKP